MAPAVLAAFAEAGILYLPIRQLMMENGVASAGPIATYPLFVCLFAGAVAAGIAVGRSKAFVTTLAALSFVLGVAQGVAGGRIHSAAVGTATILALLVGFRAVTLVFRDWRDPVRESFVIGAVALSIELMAIASFDPSLRPLLPAVVAQFFVGMLASRAATVRLVASPATPGGERRSSGGARRVRMAAAGLAGLAGMMGLAAELGGRGGPLQGLGRLVWAVVGTVLAWAALLVARVILPPLAWVFAKLHLNLGPIRSVFQRAADRGRVRPLPASGQNAGWTRVIGLVILAAIALLLVRAIRRYWRELSAAETAGREVEEPAPAPLQVRARLRERIGRRVRRELPADTVRRWYAEILLALEGSGLPRPRSATPGEYLREISRAYPGCAASFGSLTRAYEDARYGSVRVDIGALDMLEFHRDTVMEAIRRARKSGSSSGSERAARGQ